MTTEVVLQNVGNYPVVATPRFVFVNTDESFSTITAAGWLNLVSNQKILPTDIIVVNYASNTRAFFNVSIDSSGVVTMAAISNPGEVSLVGAAIAGNFPMFSGTTGDIADSGFGAPLGFFLQPAGNALTAFAGGGQTSATLLTKELNRVTVVASAADSVKLPVSAAGMDILVINSAALPMQVFGSGTDTVNGVATATGVSQMANSAVLYHCPVAGLWFSIGLGQGYSGALVTQSYSNGLTAHAGGTQAAALALPSMINNVSTVTTAADSVKLPVSAAGLNIVVINSAAANAMQVYGAGTDTINGVATATGVSQSAGTVVVYSCTAAGEWFSSVLVAQAALQLKANIKAGTTANIGGAGAGPLTVTVAGLTTASVVVASIATSSNTVSVAKAVAGTGNFDVLFSGDPGATCTLNYVAFIAAQ